MTKTKQYQAEYYTNVRKRRWLGLPTLPMTTKIRAEKPVTPGMVTIPFFGQAAVCRLGSKIKYCLKK